MKTSVNSLWIFLGVVFFTGVANVWAYPPDNAAVLYYKAESYYETGRELGKVLADFSKSTTEPNNKIREFVKENRSIIKMVLDASEVKNCDWGLDFSRGLYMEMPPLAGLKKQAILIVADARLLAADGNYEEALSRCMSLYKMARHVNDRVYISYLVGIAIHRLSNGCVIQIINKMPQDMQNLNSLKKQLAELDNVPLSIEPAIEGEREVILLTMTPEKIENTLRYLEGCVKDESIKKKILSLDKTMIDESRKYYENYFAGMTVAFDMPYAEGHAVLMGLAQKAKDDAKSKSEAILTDFLIPSTERMLTTKTCFQTQDNAIKAAIEIYLIKAETGKLPDVLPDGLPVDLFSGKPFVYEKTAGGFILRCQGKDLDKNEINSYEFKVK